MYIYVGVQEIVEPIQKLRNMKKHRNVETRSIPKVETSFPRTIIVVVKCSREETFIYEDLWKKNRAATLSVPHPKADERFYEEGVVWYGLITLNYVTHSQWWKPSSNWEMSRYEWVNGEATEKITALIERGVTVKKWNCWRLSQRLDKKFLPTKILNIWKNLLKTHTNVVPIAA